jgi:hypothetical protein
MQLRRALAGALAHARAPQPPQVVMSRTFGNAAPGGGVGVRMLVPLVDVSAGGLGPRGLWVLVTGARGGSVGWARGGRALPPAPSPRPGPAGAASGRAAARTAVAARPKPARRLSNLLLATPPPRQMLNHAGDQTDALPSGDASARDNVRCGPGAPARGPRSSIGTQALFGAALLHLTVSPLPLPRAPSARQVGRARARRARQRDRRVGDGRERQAGGGGGGGAPAVIL